MTRETHEAIKFALSNADSFNGILNVKVVYDNVFNLWMLECISAKHDSCGGSVSLIISDRTARELPKALLEERGAL